MNETVATIMKRRSMRGFKPDMPDDAALETITQCALYAPSAVNMQNWHFAVVKNANVIAQINQNASAKLNEGTKERMTARNNGDPAFSIFYFAPVVYVVSVPENDKWAAINGALATQNICLAAESLGLNTCIIGMATGAFEGPEGAELRRALCIPDGYAPIHAVSVGYGDKEMPIPPRADGRVSVIA